MDSRIDLDSNIRIVKGIRLTAKGILALLLLYGYNCTADADYRTQYSNERLQEVVARHREDSDKMLGTIARVEIGDNIVYTAADGYFDRSRQTPIKSDDSFLIASITKVFTAVLTLQLVEQGKIRLDDPLIGHLPDNWADVLAKIEYGKEITVEQALSHRSGLDDVTGDQEFWNDLLADSAGSMTQLQILRRIQKNGSARFEPGKGFDYCNTNYLLLGALVENISGQTYRTQLQRNIIERAGLNNTFLSENTFGSGKEGIAHGYSLYEGKYHDGQDFRVEWALPEGGIVSTAEDLIKFLKALRSGALFESENTFAMMTHLVGYNESYGLGLEIINDPELGLHYCHGGNFAGTRAIIAYFPESDITIAVCQTFEDRSPIQPGDLMKAIVRDITGSQAETRDIENNKTAGPFILDSLSNVVENEDVPERGIWDFDLKQVWSSDGAGEYSLVMPGNLAVDDEGKMYLLARDTGEIIVLNPDGNVILSFGGFGDGPLFQYAAELFITSANIHVLDIRDTGSKIKTFDTEGNYIGKYDVENIISPRIFTGNNKILAIRSDSGPESRPQSERLELIFLDGGASKLLTMITAEEKLVAAADIAMGRCRIMLDDIEIFARLITYFDGTNIFLGRSDKYLFKSIDLDGNEKLAFSIPKRQRKRLPAGYAEDQIDGIGQLCGTEMPDETKKQLMDGYPEKQVFFTQITTDENGFIYVFIPDVIHREKQELDIFSTTGEYLYKAEIVLPNGDIRVRPFVIKNGYLYALAKTAEGKNEIKKFEISMPSM